MKRRFIQIDGELVEVSKDFIPEPMTAVVGDIKPYKSMIDGTMITSRSQHRAHLKAHGCVEVGNDLPKNYEYKGIPDAAPQRRKELIRAQIDRLTHAEFRKAIKRDVDRVKWNSRED